ncbi:MAG: flavodoxin family protein [Acidobacteria bacterium]|nr:flavodoxin family protein [Acidobacteriota bacterium]
MTWAIINFSARPGGNSDLITRWLLKRCRADCREPQVILARNKPLEPCIGCMRCIFRHPGRCVQGDTLQEYLAALGGDHVFLVSPVYFLTPPAAWKQLQDRMLTFRPSLQRSPGHCGIFLAAGLPGWSVAEGLLAGMALSAGLTVSTVRTCYGPGPGQLVMEPANLEQVARAYELVRDGRTEHVAARCDVCFSVLSDGGSGRYCGFCQAAARADGRVHRVDTRWEPARLEEHYRRWVEATRQLYMEQRTEIRNRINTLDLPELE